MKLRSRITTLKKDTLEALRSFPILRKKRSLLVFWLLTARKAQIILILSLLSIPTVLSLSMDRVFEATFRPVTKKIVFGLIDRRKDNPCLPYAKGTGRIILWTGAAGAFTVLLILHMPAAVFRAGEKSRRDEKEADSLPIEEIQKKIVLYQRALSLAIGQQTIARIEDKLGHLKRPSSGDGLHPNQLTERTVALSDQDSSLTSLKADSNIFIGHQNRYHLKEVLGRGTTGVVYAAHDGVLERDVAVKELPPHLVHDPESLGRFRYEAKILAQLTHPYIVQVYDFVEEPGHAWIIMELIDGGELADLLREKPALSLQEVSKISIMLAEALSYAHEKDVIHRDFKPSNVMMTSEGITKITDFGLAKLAQSSQLTQTGSILGSPAYMSPEQAAGKEADRRSDIYSFGIVLYKMLTGKVPFEGDIQSVIAQHLNNPPFSPRKLMRSIPINIEHLILKMLEKEPRKRIQDMSEVLKVLKTAGKD